MTHSSICTFKHSTYFSFFAPFDEELPQITGCMRNAFVAYIWQHIHEPTRNMAEQQLLSVKKKENQKPESSRVSKSQLLELPRLLSKIAVTRHTLSEKVCHEMLETS